MTVQPLQWVLCEDMVIINSPGDTRSEIPVTILKKLLVCMALTNPTTCYAVFSSTALCLPQISMHHDFDMAFGKSLVFPYSV